MNFVLISLLVLVAPQRVRIGDNPTAPNGVVAPKVISFVQPFYTRAARENRIEGTVTVEAAFDVKGNANLLGTVKSLGYGLDENALTAFRSWKFSPALRNGVPVEVVAQIDIDFNLATAPPAESMTPLKSEQASLLRPCLSVPNPNTPTRHGLQVSQARLFCRRLLEPTAVQR
jgi:TonB family protein